VSGAVIVALLRARRLRVRWLLESVKTFLEASRRSSDAVLESLDRSLRTLDCGIDNVFVYLPSGAELTCIYATGTHVERARRLVVRRDDPAWLPARAAQTGLRVQSPAGGTTLLPTDRFALAAPLFDGRVLTAVAYVSSSKDAVAPFGDAIAAAIEHAATPYAIALEREADRADAMLDGLTGLLCSRAFRRTLRDEVARSAAARGRRVLCLWFVDADCFKAVNDRCGHPGGDDVLRALAALLESHLIADVDLAARNGGDEFCALLRGASKSRAIERAQAFCEAVRRYDFGVPMRVTTSVGVAAYPYDAASSSALLETADAAMYHSKRCGGDRVSFVVASGAFASVRAEAARELSRSPSRCRSILGDSFVQRWSP
jgi:diguanylate cyclase (GGDEF)-like protein